MQRFNISGCQKTFSETKCYLSTILERPTYLSTLTSVQRINHNFNITLILDKYNIMIVMQNLKFMQEFTFAINVEYLQSSLHAKQLMHSYARAKHAKTCFCSIQRTLRVQPVEWKISAYDAHIQKQ